MSIVVNITKFMEVRLCFHFHFLSVLNFIYLTAIFELWTELVFLTDFLFTVRWRQWRSALTSRSVAALVKLSRSEYWVHLSPPRLPSCQFKQWFSKVKYTRKIYLKFFWKLGKGSFYSPQSGRRKGTKRPNMGSHFKSGLRRPSPSLTSPDFCWGELNVPFL